MWSWSWWQKLGAVGRHLFHDRLMDSLAGDEAEVCCMFVVYVVMMCAWDVVAGAGRTWLGVGASASREGGEMKKRAPSCVYRRREGQVRAGGVACVAVPAWCTWHGGTAWLCVTGTWMGAVWGVVCGEVRGNVCVLCGAVFGNISAAVIA